MSLFESRLLAEGLRAVEGDSPSVSTCVDKSSESDFESLLLKRAQQRDQALQISVLFSHFKRVVKNCYALLSLLLFMPAMIP